jgi:hypothetical protein
MSSNFEVPELVINTYELLKFIKDVEILDMEPSTNWITMNQADVRWVIRASMLALLFDRVIDCPEERRPVIQ